VEQVWKVWKISTPDYQVVKKKSLLLEKNWQPMKKGADYSLERRIGVKIGLLLLIVILYVAGIFIYSLRMKRDLDVQKVEIASANELLAQSNRLVLSVQQAQEVLNQYLMHPKSTVLQQYDSISATIPVQIARLKQLASQRDRELYLESMDSLLNEKRRIVNQLTLQFRSQSPIREINRKLERYNDLVLDSVVVTTNEDTTLVVKDKKGLWTRLKKLVNPNRVPDTIISVTRVEQETRLTSRIDTAVYSDLKSVTQVDSEHYSTQLSGIEKRVRELILAEQNISLQISQLLSQFYNEATAVSQQGIESSERLTLRIFTFAVVIGSLSLMLILVIILLIADDLKQGQRARLDLAREKQNTESLMESRHQLLLSVSHDIKTPLSSMMGYMEMWQDEHIPESIKKQLRSALNSGKHILSMLMNLLEFSRLERNAGELHLSRFNLSELLEEIIRLFRPLTENKKLDIELEELIEPPCYIETDHTVLRQILINVVSNAVKYSVEGGVTIRSYYENGLVFSIRDTGIGMNESDLREIFKPFSRIENPLKAEGNGFGMYVTQGLVHLLNGEITVRSGKGEGTCVTIRLPLHPVEAPADENGKGFHPPLKNYRKVLLFEDDLPLGNLIREFLQRRGFKVKVCSDSRDIEGFVNHLSLFNIVFTDMQMPTVTGNEILEKIRKVNASIPVWLISAHGDYNGKRARSEGFSGFITKPVRLERLVDILSGEGEAMKEEPPPLNGKFPQLEALFGDDAMTIREILSSFVNTLYRDTGRLEVSIRESAFREAQEICHKIHPFVCQLGARHLCDALIRMDSLRGEEETAYPAWREELSSTIRQLRTFADNIREEYLS
jgi:two-component system sensor histidine kinase EvgS